jgi:molecular chaperone HscB
MLLEEAKMGGVDDDLRGQLVTTREGLTARLNKFQDELHEAWKQWDNGDSKATALMVDVLNRRSYLRNLVRDIDEVLK